jgi:hypothetical protein
LFKINENTDKIENKVESGNNKNINSVSPEPPQKKKRGRKPKNPI